MISIPEYVKKVLEALRREGHVAYPVGGCVRDGIMGIPPKDWDIGTSARPEESEKALSAWKIIETGIRHGTITVLAEGHPIEITTFRKEHGYADGRHPDRVEFVGKLEEDLARRDFTMNAMALDADGSVLDPFGGQKDIQKGIIRCVGEPKLRFSEDALRILRALRFASRMKFTVEPLTAEAAVDECILLNKISSERVFSELKEILVGPAAGTVLRQFPEIVFEIIPELRASFGFEQHNRYHIHDVWTHSTMAVDGIEADPVLRLTMLLHDVAKPHTFKLDDTGTGHFYGHAEASAKMADGILRRLRCDNATREEVMWLIAHHSSEPPLTKKAARRLLLSAGEYRYRRLLACWRADVADRAENIRAEDSPYFDAAEKYMEELLEEMDCMSLRDLAINGEDLRKAGMSPGPELGRVLNELFRAVTEENVPNERNVLLDLAKTMIK